MQLFKEIGEWKAKTDKLTAELETLQEKLAAAQTAQQASPSMVCYLYYIFILPLLVQFFAPFHYCCLHFLQVAFSTCPPKKQ